MTKVTQHVLYAKCGNRSVTANVFAQSASLHIEERVVYDASGRELYTTPYAILTTVGAIEPFGYNKKMRGGA